MSRRADTEAAALALADALRVGRVPRGSDREDRVRLLGEFAEAVLAGKRPDPTALLHVAGGISAWLNTGGSLTRDHWRTAGRKGSTHTEAVLWGRIVARGGGSSRRATDAPDLGSVEPSKSPKEKR